MAWPKHRETEQAVFRGTDVEITTDGLWEPWLVVRNSRKFKRTVEDVEEFTEVAQDETKAVNTSFTKAVWRRCTILDIGHLFVPLEELIREKSLIPAIIGQKIIDNLTLIIVNQERDFTNDDEDEVKRRIVVELKREKEKARPDINQNMWWILDLDQMCLAECSPNPVNC